MSGVFPTLYALSGFVLKKNFWKAFLPLFAVHFMLMQLVARAFPDVPRPAQMDAEDIARLQSRLNLDGFATIAAVGLGYVCFVYVSVTEARRYFRVHLEMELATEIHRVIVPAIDMKMGAFEFYGRSVPSGEVGGDLIDVAGTEENWVAYLADVSGHGVAPGVVMGMVKSAARMLLSSGDDSRHLMPRLNEVLYPLKKPDMFATLLFCGEKRRRIAPRTCRPSRDIKVFGHNWGDHAAGMSEYAAGHSARRRVCDFADCDGSRRSLRDVYGWIA
jgi:hypothetical protein